MKKLKTLLLMCLIMFSVCGCGIVNKFEPTLVEVKNPDNTYSYKNSRGKIVFSHLEYQLFFNNGFSVYEENGKYGVVNTKGKIVIQPIYDWLEGYQDGMCACFYEDSDEVKILYYNDEGKVAIQPMVACETSFSDLYDCNFYNGIAVYRNPKNHKYGYIDKTGKTVLSTIYDWAEPFKSDITVVSINGNYKFIDRTGKEALKIKCQLMQPFSDGLAAIMVGGKWGYIDKTGNWVIKPQYGSFSGHDGEEIACDFYKGYTGVYLGNGQAYDMNDEPQKFALIDKTGKILNGVRYDGFFQTRDEKGETIYHVVKNGEEYRINYCGKRINY